MERSRLLFARSLFVWVFIVAHLMLLECDDGGRLRLMLIVMAWDIIKTAAANWIDHKRRSIRRRTRVLFYLLSGPTYRN